MHFVKMHGIANDYIYIDAFNAPEMESHFEGDHGRRLIREMSHRHTGVGSDGVILVCRANPGVDAHLRMRMFNADGSESEMCGNGIRCVAKFGYDRLGVRAQPMLIETGRGVLSIDYVVDDGMLTEATVDMGAPIVELAAIPANLAHLLVRGAARYAVQTADRCWGVTLVSMGNPHAVIFENGPADFTPAELAALELFRIGPEIETHPAFPNRANVHVVAPHSRTEATMRTWERGAGLTQACGTGACAVLVAGVLTDRLERKAVLHLPGGDLTIQWDELTNHVFMTGPAEDVFEGEWPDY